MKRQTGRFVAIGDDGRQYTVFVYTNFIDAVTFENPNAVIEGLNEFRTADGLAINPCRMASIRLCRLALYFDLIRPTFFDEKYTAEPLAAT